MPSVTHSMKPINLGNKGYYDTSGNPQSGYGLVDDPLNPNDESLFTHLTSYLYWSGLEYAPDTDQAWRFFFIDGGQNEGFKSRDFYAWAVRPGDVAAAPGGNGAPEPGSLMLAGRSPPCRFFSMARYEHLPIYKAALDVAVGFEKLVAGFSRLVENRSPVIEEVFVKIASCRQPLRFLRGAASSNPRFERGAPPASRLRAPELARRASPSLPLRRVRVIANMRL